MNAKTFKVAVLHWLGARRRGRIEQRLGELATQRVIQERRWLGDNDLHLRLQPCLVTATENELRDKVRRPPRGFTEWHAEADKIFCVYFK